MRSFKKVFPLLCLILLLVNCCRGSKERSQRKKITLAEFLYQRLHKLGIKRNRHRITSGVTAERRADKVNYLLQNQDRDPNLAVLRNYFRKMKTLPQTVQKRPDTVKSETTVEGYNPFAGFGPIVSQHSRHKKSNKIARKKNRSRRKIFLTVNEAFSESDHGRELRPRNINYLVFVPAPDTEQPPPSPGQQDSSGDGYDDENRRIDTAEVEYVYDMTDDPDSDDGDDVIDITRQYSDTDHGNQPITTLSLPAEEDDGRYTTNFSQHAADNIEDGNLFNFGEYYDIIDGELDQAVEEIRNIIGLSEFYTTNFSQVAAEDADHTTASSEVIQLGIVSSSNNEAAATLQSLADMETVIPTLGFEDQTSGSFILNNSSEFYPDVLMWVTTTSTTTTTTTTRPAGGSLPVGTTTTAIPTSTTLVLEQTLSSSTTTTSITTTTTTTMTTTTSSTSTTTIGVSTTTTTASTSTTTTTTTTSMTVTSSEYPKIPAQLPLVQEAGLARNTVLIPIGQGLYYKFWLNRDTALDLNTADIV